jgi:hypothetical protein
MPTRMGVGPSVGEGRLGAACLSGTQAPHSANTHATYEELYSFRKEEAQDMRVQRRVQS